MNPLIRPWRQLFNFKGRATRTEYGLYHLSAVALVVAFEAVFVMLVRTISGPAGGNGEPAIVMLGLFNGLAIIIGLPLLYVGHIAVSIRRLHDHGQPGIRFLLTFIPLVGIFFWLMMAFTRGDAFENDFGPDPRQPEQIGQGDLGGVFS
jgi:uncharacterized membrane protein YhaH (DUF805 family)